VDKIEGTLHDLTGIALFVVAVALMFICEGLINLVARIFARLRSPSQVAKA